MQDDPPPRGEVNDVLGEDWNPYMIGRDEFERVWAEVLGKVGGLTFADSSAQTER
jgi:hypothetical protein